MANESSWSAGNTGQMHLSDAASKKLRDALPDAGARAVAAIRAEVPVYAGTMSNRMWTNIQHGVALSLGTFIDAAVGARAEADALHPAIKGAYELGRGEAHANRTMEGLHAAFRVGSRAAWERLGTALLEGGVSASDIVVLAGRVFAYTDQLSTASAAGHAAATDATGRERERRRGELARAFLVADVSTETLYESAEQADWFPPETLTAVLVPSAQSNDIRGWVDARTLFIEESDVTTLFVPDADGAARDRLIATLRGRRAILGPSISWTKVAESHRRALRLLELVRSGDVEGDPAEADLHLAALVVHADSAARADLRKRVLEPLAGQRPVTYEKLVATLRSWLLHALADNRRDLVAADLFVHPQTIRYRVGQLRELFGDRLDDPDYVRDLVIALA